MSARHLLSFALRVVAPAALVGATLLGCSNFDQEDEIKDLRVLAIRTEPAEIVYSAVYALLAPEDRPPGFPVPEYDVSVEVYAFDPRGGLVKTEMKMCPENAPHACLTYDPTPIFDRFEGEDRAEVEAVWKPTVRDSEVNDTSLDPTGRFLGTRFDYHFSSAVMDSLIRDENGNAGISPFPGLPEFVVKASNDSVDEVQSEIAFKRFPLTIDLADPIFPPDLKAQLGDLLGLTFCEEPPDYDTFVEGITDCYFTRPANSNPDLIGFDLVDAEEEAQKRQDAILAGEEVSPITFKDTALLGTNPLLRVDPGAELTIRPVFPEGDREMYQVFGFDLENNELTLENRLEDFAFNWYITRGEGPGTTNPQFEPTVDGTWTLPSDAKSGERDAMVLVVRDQRGGTTVGQVTVEYR